MKWKKTFTAHMTLKEREWFIMTFRMTAKPENELRLLYYENKRVLHICYIEKRGSICNKKRKNFQKCRPNPFFLWHISLLHPCTMWEWKNKIILPWFSDYLPKNNMVTIKIDPGSLRVEITWLTKKNWPKCHFCRFFPLSWHLDGTGLLVS